VAVELKIDLVLTDRQNWASRSHRELYDAVHTNNDPGQTGEIGAEWDQFGTELTESARVINERVAATEAGWTGEAADAARAAIKQLANWITETATTAVEVGKRVEDQSRIMENARARMPEPVEFSWDEATGAFSGGGLQGLLSSATDVQAANELARSAHEQAVTVMTAMEDESRAVDRGTPMFTPPFNPVTGRVEEPRPAALLTAGVPALSEALPVQGASGAGGGTHVSGYAPSVTPATPAYTPGGGAGGGGGYGGGAGGGAGGGQGTPQVPAAAYRPEGTTAAAAAAQVPVANKYTPPAHQLPPGGGHQPPGGYVPPGYTPPGGSSGRQQPPPYRPAPPGTVVPKPQGGFGPNGKLPPYIPAGSPGTPPVPGSGGGGAPRVPGFPGAMPGGFGGGGGGGGGFGGGGFGGGHGGGGHGGGGFGPTGSGGQLGAGGASGALGAGPRGAAPGGFAPGAPGGAAGAGAPMGGAPMGGAGGGQGEDKEHRAAAYLRGEDIFEVPGENLPPSVIGGAKPRKKADQ